MGSSLVTAKVTSPPDSSQQSAVSCQKSEVSRQQPADRSQQSAVGSQQSAAVMSSGSRPVSWVNIPITRTVNTIVASVVEELQQQQQQRGPKRVRWSEELTQVRYISPRYKAAPFRFQSPSRRASSPPSSYSSPPRSSLTSSHLHCSPQLQKVVFRAVNNNNNNNNLESNSNSTSYWRGGGHSSGWRP